MPQPQDDFHTVLSTKFFNAKAPSFAMSCQHWLNLLGFGLSSHHLIAAW